MTHSDTSTLVGAVTISTGAASTSTTTGSLIVTGGAGVSGAVWVGSTLNVAGSTPASNDTTAIVQQYLLPVSMILLVVF